MATIGKQELIRRVATKAGKSAKETTDLVNATLESVRESLEAGDDVRLVGFGAFSVRSTAARVGVNPQTREKIQVPARQRVKFTPGKELNDAVTAKVKGGKK
jgi:DNA-binding protein HU-beta